MSTCLGYGILDIWTITNLNVVMKVYSDIIGIENIRLCIDISFHNSTETTNPMKVLRKKRD